MSEDLGLLVLRLAIGGVALAHGSIKIGWPLSMGARGLAAVRGTAGFWVAVSITAEIGGSLLVILGWAARSARRCCSATSSS